VGLLPLDLVAAGLVAVVGALLFATDRRRQLRGGRYRGPSSDGRGAVTVDVEVAATRGVAEARARDALRRQSRTRITEAAPGTWVGWSGRSLRSWGQELSVTVVPTGESSFRLRCSSRPRFAAVLVDWGASRESAHALAAAAGQLPVPKRPPVRRRRPAPVSE
jgi:hypothetical protein